MKIRPYRPRRKLAALLAFLTLSMLLMPAAFAQGNLQRRSPRIGVMQLNHGVAAPEATFESARVVHRIKYNNKWWMRIHIKFRIKNAHSTPCKLYAYFYDDEDGEALEAGDDPKYRTSDGTVYTSGADFTPGLVDAVYNDFQIFLPYEALNLDTDPGSEYHLKYFLMIRDESTNKFFAKSGWYKFDLKY